MKNEFAFQFPLVKKLSFILFKLCSLVSSNLTGPQSVLKHALKILGLRKESEGLIETRFSFLPE